MVERKWRSEGRVVSEESLWWEPWGVVEWPLVRREEVCRSLQGAGQCDQIWRLVCSPLKTLSWSFSVSSFAGWASPPNHSSSPCAGFITWITYPLFPPTSLSDLCSSSSSLLFPPQNWRTPSSGETNNLLLNNTTPQVPNLFPCSVCLLLVCLLPLGGLLQTRSLIIAHQGVRCKTCCWASSSLLQLLATVLSRYQPSLSSST